MGEASGSGAISAPRAGGLLGNEKRGAWSTGSPSGVFQASAALPGDLGEEGDAAGRSSTHRKGSSTASPHPGGSRSSHPQPFLLAPPESRRRSSQTRRSPCPQPPALSLTLSWAHSGSIPLALGGSIDPNDLIPPLTNALSSGAASVPRPWQMLGEAGQGPRPALAQDSGSTLRITSLPPNPSTTARCLFAHHPSLGSLHQAPCNCWEKGGTRGHPDPPRMGSRNQHF